MKKVTYLAILEPTESGYSVYFPDLPGCISCGNSVDDTIQNAEEALGLHIYGMEKDHVALPIPSKEPKVYPETASGYMVAPITVFPSLVREEMDNRNLKTTVTVPAWLKELAEEAGVNYSKLLQAALIDYLGVKSREHARH